MASGEQVNQILTTIQSQAISSQKQLNIVRAQMASKERSKTMDHLTLKQLESDDRNSKMYRGVGKMFVTESRDTIFEELTARQKEATDDISNLSKKQKYLEKQLSDSTAHLKDIFSSMDRAAAAQA